MVVSKLWRSSDRNARTFGLRCRNQRSQWHRGRIRQHDIKCADFDDDKPSKELKCEGDDKGPVTELKVGTEDNQRVVAIEPHEGRSGSSLALVYVHTRGKQGDI